METVRDFISLGSKITADGDCSHEIKTRLLLGRRAMTNLDTVIKSRDITLLTKVHLVKAMVFPVIMYGCKSWTIKRAELLKNWCFWIVMLEKTLEALELQVQASQSWGKSVLNVHLEGLMLKLQYFGHLMQRTDSLEKTLMLGTIEAGEGDSQSILKEISPEYSLEGLMLKLKYFDHLMQRTDSFEKTLMLGKI